MMEATAVPPLHPDAVHNPNGTWDHGNFRWRINGAGKVMAFIEYHPNHETRGGFPWKRVWFAMEYRG